MTLAMPDSINVPDLPSGYDAYLGYTDGRWPTAGALAVKFPHAELVRLTVTGGLLADGIDIEPGNVNVATARVWVQRKLAAEPGFRPVVYASTVGQPNFGMGDMIAALTRNGITLDRVRLLSAHYGQGAHICGPDSCGEIDVEMDGTQWTDAFVVATSQGLPVNIDMSMLADDFFTGSTGLSRTERIVQQLGTVHAGMTGETVKTVQGLCNARTPVAELRIDGIFGVRTVATVMAIQANAKIADDGIVGPKTWSVLLGVA